MSNVDKEWSAWEGWEYSALLPSGLQQRLSLSLNGEHDKHNANFNCRTHWTHQGLKLRSYNNLSSYDQSKNLLDYMN